MTITLPDFKPGREWYRIRREPPFMENDYDEFCAQNPHVRAEWGVNGEITIRPRRDPESSSQGLRG